MQFHWVESVTKILFFRIRMKYSFDMVVNYILLYVYLINKELGGYN